MAKKLGSDQELKLGIIGMSPGNAHPYSWSSIINGVYDGAEINRIGYPGVTDYLDKYRDDLGIDGAKVTHVWAQKAEITQSIAKSSGIAHQVNHFTDMIGEVDAVILARDDPEHHRKMAEPFIKAGVPIFIDKPLAANLEDLEYFTRAEAEGKWIMSCSSMRYAPVVEESRSKIKNLGKIPLVTAVGKKDWLKYGVHMLEAVFSLLDDPIPASVWSVGEPDKAIVRVKFKNGTLVTAHLFQDIASTFQVTVFGQNNFIHCDFNNSYTMFRANLEEFIRGLRAGKSLLPYEKTYHVVRAVIAGLESMESGEEVFLD